MYNWKDEIKHCLRPSVKCLAPLFRDMSLAKVRNAGGGAPGAHYSSIKLGESYIFLISRKHDYARGTKPKH